METQLSPEAVEALARSLANKMEGQMSANRDLADQMLIFHQNDAEFKREDAVFKDEVRAALRNLRRERTYLPHLAMIAAVFALLISAFTMSRTASATQSLSTDIQGLKDAVAAQHVGR
jgi:hypothetical protein